MALFGYTVSNNLSAIMELLRTCISFFLRLFDTVNFISKSQRYMAYGSLFISFFFSEYRKFSEARLGEIEGVNF